MMYFGYTFCPEVCPTTLTDLSRLDPAAWAECRQAQLCVRDSRSAARHARGDVRLLSTFDKHIRGLTGTAEQIAKIAEEYRVYYKRIPTTGGDYVTDHSAIIYLMGAKGNFVGTIAYQESDASAFAKLSILWGRRYLPDAAYRTTRRLSALRNCVFGSRACRFDFRQLIGEATNDP